MPPFFDEANPPPEPWLTLEDRNRKLEDDIGKLRVAFGDVKMKEIIGR